MNLLKRIVNTPTGNALAHCARFLAAFTGFVAATTLAVLYCPAPVVFGVWAVSVGTYFAIKIRRELKETK